MRVKSARSIRKGGVEWTNGSQPGGKSRSKTAIICTDSQSRVETGIVRGARVAKAKRGYPRSERTCGCAK
jgi:hypothetical protein